MRVYIRYDFLLDEAVLEDELGNELGEAVEITRDGGMMLFGPLEVNPG